MKAVDLIEAGPPYRANELACLVVVDAGEDEVNLSFYDHQYNQFIGPDGLTRTEQFFRATKRILVDGRTGYVVGQEVTRSLRRNALFGIKTSTGQPLGELRSKVRAFVNPKKSTTSTSFNIEQKGAVQDRKANTLESKVASKQTPRRDWTQVEASLLSTVGEQLATPSPVIDNTPLTPPPRIESENAPDPDKRIAQPGETVKLSLEPQIDAAKSNLILFKASALIPGAIAGVLAISTFASGYHPFITFTYVTAPEGIFLIAVSGIAGALGASLLAGDHTPSYRVIRSLAAGVLMLGFVLLLANFSAAEDLATPPWSPFGHQLNPVSMYVPHALIYAFSFLIPFIFLRKSESKGQAMWGMLLWSLFACALLTWSLPRFDINHAISLAAQSHVFAAGVFSLYWFASYTAALMVIWGLMRFGKSRPANASSAAQNKISPDNKSFDADTGQKKLDHRLIKTSGFKIKILVLGTMAGTVPFFVATLFASGRPLPVIFLWDLATAGALLAAIFSIAHPAKSISASLLITFLASFFLIYSADLIDSNSHGAEILGLVLTSGLATLTSLVQIILIGRSSKLQVGTLCAFSLFIFIVRLIVGNPIIPNNVLFGLYLYLLWVLPFCVIFFLGHRALFGVWPLLFRDSRSSVERLSG